MTGLRFQVSGFSRRERAQPFRADARTAPFASATSHRSPLQRGFTLVEMLVAVSIFSIVMVISVGSLIVLLTAGSVAQSAQSVASNLSFAVDTIARNIRTGYDYYCTDTVTSDGAALPTSTRDCTSGGAIIVYTDGATGERRAFRFDSTTDALYQKIEDGSWVRLTSSDIVIDPFEFIVTGAVGGNAVQPLVRIVLKAEATDERMEIYPFYIQTTVTSKQLNI